MTSDEDWVKLAMSDDSVVAELLSRLRRPDKPPPPPTALALRLDWSVRQRRTRAPTRHHHHEDVKTRTKKTKKEMAEPSRASPTTPLSWSGAASLSGGSEESSKPTLLAGDAAARSKVSVRRSDTTISKRPRRKKTLAELREEETLLLKESKKLKREIEAMRLNIQKQRAVNESYCRLKLDLESQQKPETVTEHGSALPTTENLDAPQRSCALSASCKVKEVESRESGFPLPDLNLPAEGDLGSSAALYGITS